MIREGLILEWVVSAIGFGLFSTLNESSGLGKQIGYAILTGFGVGQNLRPCVSIQLIDFSNQSIGYLLNPLGLSDANVQSSLNQPEGFLGSFRDSGETEQIRSELIFAYRKGFPVTFIVGAGLAATATLIVFCLMP